MIQIEENLNIYFPMDLKPRRQQIEMLEMTKKSINGGKKFILLNAPVGSGKSFYVSMMANFYRNYVNSNAKFDIITNSKILQEQYKRDFDFINDLRGQSNYRCARHRTDCHTGKEMNKALKQGPCGICNYDNDRQKWVTGDISLTNFHLYNSFAFYVSEIMDSREANVLIVDEAHLFEEVFCDFISIKLSAKILKNYGMEDVMIERYDRKLNKINSVGQFINFLNNDFIPYIVELRENFELSIGDITETKIKEIYAKYVIYIESAEERFDRFLTDYVKNENNWTLDITKDKNNNVELIMQPIWGNVYLNDIIFERYDHVIFMSGSILDKNMFSYINGFDENLTDYYELDSVFPLKNRPIFYIKTGKMTYNDKEETFKEQVKIIEKILKKYENDKGIIHTTNYELSNWIQKSIKDKRLIFHETNNREEQLDKFKSKKKNGVIVSPSMVSGISLDDDLSRFQIIMKVPYPNISSNKIKARQASNRRWYAWRTIMDILQAYGRSVRSDTDWAHTFILDSSLGDLLKYNRELFPNYFIEAIKQLK